MCAQTNQGSQAVKVKRFEVTVVTLDSLDFELSLEA